MESWNRHFMKILESSYKRVVMQNVEERGEEEKQRDQKGKKEDEISRKYLSNWEKGKTPKENGIDNKAEEWRRKKLVVFYNLVNRVWKDEVY